jgi:hypothetical protein
MDEKILKIGIRRRAGFYSVREGKIYRLYRGKQTIEAHVKLTVEDGYNYYLDSDGDVARTPSDPEAHEKHAAQQSFWANANRHYPPLDCLSSDRRLAGIGFRQLPIRSVRFYESLPLTAGVALSALRIAGPIAAKNKLSVVISTVSYSGNEALTRAISKTGKRDVERAKRVVPRQFFAKQIADKELFSGTDEEPDGRQELARQRQLLKNLPDRRPKTKSNKRHFQILESSEKVFLQIVSCDPWQIPVWHPFGGWNDAPEPFVVAGILRHWQKQYGAALIVVGPDYLEMAANMLEPAQLKKAAWEHFLFCDGIVYQGTGTVAALASEIRGGRWFFWWD